MHRLTFPRLVSLACHDLRTPLASITGAVRCGYVYVDGLSVGEVTEASLKDRLPSDVEVRVTFSTAER